MNPNRVLRDRLLVALGAASLIGCIDEVVVRDDGGQSTDAEVDARVIDEDMTVVVVDPRDARVPRDAGSQTCQPGTEFWCVPEIDGACLEVEPGTYSDEIHAFLQQEIEPLCGLRVESGPLPVPPGEDQPCCYCLGVELCGGRPFVVARDTVVAPAVSRGDWV